MESPTGRNSFFPCLGQTPEKKNLRAPGTFGVPQRCKPCSHPPPPPSCRACNVLRDGKSHRPKKNFFPRGQTPEKKNLRAPGTFGVPQRCKPCREPPPPHTPQTTTYRPACARPAGARRAPAGGRRGRIRPARPMRTTRRGAGRAWEPARRSVRRGRQSGPKVETDQNGVRARRQGYVHAAQMRQHAAGSRPARCPQEQRMGGGRSLAVSAHKPRPSKLCPRTSARLPAGRATLDHLGGRAGSTTAAGPAQGGRVGDLETAPAHPT